MMFTYYYYYFMPLCLLTAASPPRSVQCNDLRKLLLVTGVQR